MAQLMFCPGYLAIHLLGLSAGTLLLPPSPSVFRHQRDELLASSSTGRPLAANDGRSRRGSIILPKDKRENDKTAMELCAWVIVFWVLLGISNGVGIGGGISRRLVSTAEPEQPGCSSLALQTNLPYVLYVVAVNTTFILGFLVLDLVFFPSPMSKSVYSPNSGLKVQSPKASTASPGRASLLGMAGQSAAPKLLEAINKNGLVFFLVVR